MRAGCNPDLRDAKAAEALKDSGRPEEVAAAILFAARDDASFVTGPERVVDGGYTAR